MVILTIRDGFYGGNSERKFERGSNDMKPSQLVAIVQRFQTMAAQDSDIEVRRFEKMALKKLSLLFNQETSSFELVDVETNQTFQFDDIDLVTIEILKCYKIK